MKLSIIIPAHNEEHRLPPMLEAYASFFSERYGEGVELLVVPNFCDDRTAEVAKKIGRCFPQISVLDDPGRVGKGGAVLLGFSKAKGGLIGYVDADGATPPDAFDDLVRHSGEAPVVIASRWCKGAVVEPAQPLLRRITSRAFNLLTRVLFGFRLTDTQCGAKVFDRDVVESILAHGGTVTQWAFDVDLLLEAKRAGFGIFEIPTTWRDVEGSKIVVTESSLEMLVAVFRLRLLYSPFKWIVTLYDRTLGRNGNAGTSDHLIRHSLLLAMGSQVSNGANLLFQIVMAHLLVGDDAVEYGVMAAMMGSIQLISVPLGAVGRSMTHAVALACKENRREEVIGMVRVVSRDLMLVAFLPGLAAVVFSRQLAKGFHIESVLPVIIVVVTIAVRILMPVFQGALTGIQAFRSSAVLGAVQSVLRVVLAAILVFAGMGAAGALGGNMLAMLGALVLVMVLVYRMLPSCSAKAFRPVGFYRSVVLYFFAMAGLALLTMSDVVIVKRFFSPEEAGTYALAAMVARIVFFLPLPIGAAMFPKVVSISGNTGQAVKTFRKGLVMTMLCLLVPALMLEWVPSFFIRILTGVSDERTASLVRLLVIAYLPLPLITLIVNYHLAQSRTVRVAIPLLLSAGAYILGAKVLGGGVVRVPILLGGSGYALLAWFGLCSIYKSIRGGRVHRGRALIDETC